MTGTREPSVETLTLVDVLKKQHLCFVQTNLSNMEQASILSKNNSNGDDAAEGGDKKKKRRKKKPKPEGEHTGEVSVNVLDGKVTPLAPENGGEEKEEKSTEENGEKKEKKKADSKKTQRRAKNKDKSREKHLMDNVLPFAATDSPTLPEDHPEKNRKGSKAGASSDGHKKERKKSKVHGDKDDPASAEHKKKKKHKKKEGENEEPAEGEGGEKKEKSGQDKKAAKKKDKKKKTKEKPVEKSETPTPFEAPPDIQIDDPGTAATPLPEATVEPIEETTAQPANDRVNTPPSDNTNTLDDIKPVELEVLPPEVTTASPVPTQPNQIEETRNEPVQEIRLTADAAAPPKVPPTAWSYSPIPSRPAQASPIPSQPARVSPIPSRPAPVSPLPPRPAPAANNSSSYGPPSATYGASLGSPLKDTSSIGISNRKMFQGTYDSSNLDRSPSAAPSYGSYWGTTALIKPGSHFNSRVDSTDTPMGVTNPYSSHYQPLSQAESQSTLRENRCRTCNKELNGMRETLNCKKCSKPIPQNDFGKQQSSTSTFDSNFQYHQPDVGQQREVSQTRVAKGNNCAFGDLGVGEFMGPDGKVQQCLVCFDVHLLPVSDGESPGENNNTATSKTRLTGYEDKRISNQRAPKFKMEGQPIHIVRDIPHVKCGGCGKGCACRSKNQFPVKGVNVSPTRNIVRPSRSVESTTRYYAPKQDDRSYYGSTAVSSSSSSDSTESVASYHSARYAIPRNNNFREDSSDEEDDYEPQKPPEVTISIPCPAYRPSVRSSYRRSDNRSGYFTEREPSPFNKNANPARNQEWFANIARLAASMCRKRVAQALNWVKPATSDGKLAVCRRCSKPLFPGELVCSSDGSFSTRFSKCRCGPRQKLYTVDVNEETSEMLSTLSDKVQRKASKKVSFSDADDVRRTLSNIVDSEFVKVAQKSDTASGKMMVDIIFDLMSDNGRAQG